MNRRAGAPRARRLLRSAGLACLWLLIGGTIAAVGQSNAGIDSDPGDRGTGGVNTIQGRIYYPGGRRFDQRVRVRLVSVTGGERTTLSDDSGEFIFRRLRGGSYEVTVDVGKSYEPVRERVDIVDPVLRRSDVRGQTVTLQINLQPAVAESRPVGTVDASLAAIPEEARNLYQEALAASGKGESDKAIDLLTKAIALAPDFMLAHNEMGAQYLRRREWKKAAAALETAVRLAPDAFAPRLNYGVARLQLKEYPQAAAELQKAVQKDGHSGPAHLHYGRALIGLGRYDAAAVELQKAIDLGGPERVEAHRYLGAVYIEKGDKRRAAEALTQYLNLNPKAKDAEQIRAIIRQLQGS